MKTTHIKNTIWIMLVAVASVSCKKDDPKVTEDTKSTIIKDLPADLTASMSGADGKELRPFYPLVFNLTDKSSHLLKSKSDSTEFLQTSKWDLAFTGPYNSEVFLNNGENIINPGFGGPARGTAVIKLDQAYDMVNQAPDDDAFDNSGITKIGWSSSQFPDGWFFYSLDNHICVPIKNRTYILRLASGKYAKLEIQNIYKGNPPIVTDLFWPAPFLSFRYYVQGDGSKNLKTK